MKAVKGVYENGRIDLSERPTQTGPVEVVVVFPDSEIDPWEAILNDETPRPSFSKFVEECKEEIRQGKTVPLDFDQL